MASVEIFANSTAMPNSMNNHKKHDDVAMLAGNAMVYLAACLRIGCLFRLYSAA